MAFEYEANKPIQTKYKDVYYYGYYYTIPDTDAMLSEAKKKADMKDQADTNKTLGIVLLGMGITMGIVGGVLSGSKMVGVGAKDNNKPDNYHFFLTTIDINTPAIGIRYNF